MLSTWVVRLGLDYLVEKLDLVDGGFGIMGCGTNDLEGDVLVGVVVAGKPDGGEVTPTELTNNRVFSILELLSDLNGMVTTLAVIFRIFLVGGVFGGVVNGRRGWGVGHGGG